MQTLIKIIKSIFILIVLWVISFLINYWLISGTEYIWAGPMWYWLAGIWIIIWLIELVLIMVFIIRKIFFGKNIPNVVKIWFFWIYCSVISLSSVLFIIFWSYDIPKQLFILIISITIITGMYYFLVKKSIPSIIKIRFFWIYSIIISILTIVFNSVNCTMLFDVNYCKNALPAEKWFILIISIIIIAGMYYFLIKKWSNSTLSNEISKENNNTNISKETLDLMSTLSQVDISNINSITFIPATKKGFMIMTPNIKRLSVYITTKRWKTKFEPEELRKTFDYVVENISSDISKEDFDLIQVKIGEFVRSGGEIKIDKV